MTGGAGFIGSNLAESLVKDGEDIIILDNLHTGKKENISGFGDRIRFINKPVSEISSLEEGIKEIYHLGIPSSTNIYRNNPKAVGSSINDFIDVMEYASKNGSRVVFSSSSSLYNGQEPPHREDMRILAKDYYTEARYAMERIAEMYNDMFSVNTICLRFLSVYGKNELGKGASANVLTQFFWKMKGGESPIVYGDGNQTRDLIYVDDVVLACKLAMKSDVSFGVFNVGTGTSYNYKTIVEKINNLLGTCIAPKYIENPINNYVFHTLADTTKAQRILGFKARYSLDDGLKKLASFY